ncbi:MAG: hypothetical protein ACHBMF_00750 [Chromatiales bacterium]
MGDREQAREAAHRLCALAGRPGERTYLAQGYRLLAEIALAEQHWEEAEADIARALAVLAGAEVPLAAWRVYATAAELNDRQGRTAEARAYWNRSAAVIHALADSLEEANPLRQSLLTALPVQAILGRATSSECCFRPGST